MLGRLVSYAIVLDLQKYFGDVNVGMKSYLAAKTRSSVSEIDAFLVLSARTVL